MTTAAYLEQYLDTLENLPVELQRNFTLMRELDSRVQAVMQKIDESGDDFLKNIKLLSSEERQDRMKKIQEMFNKVKALGDDKVQLSIQTYELVDKHIRRLDSDLARFESEIQDKANHTRNQMEENEPVKRGRKKLKEKEPKKKSRAAGTSSEDENNKGTKKKQKKSGAAGGTGPGKNAANSTSGGLPVESTLASVLPGLVGVVHPTDVLDMPVDPNEPTYCLCHQVSYGEMIGCDNPDCPIEWFHFACVGLTTKPKGKWFCPKCTADRKKK
ncbi:unnamed protein product [Bemisia tabaci]|uniref:Inhibitor of growth protein n=1 Tax=Bemisia tabaci TaxID=7038 RepID=A0A9P0F133_BEMTA|nr:PREDICTED: inhibitor of growth protein 4 [Bemisia tabaci]CAH0385272.1 unnamed protein product [Bemisia tabaci]